MKRPKWMALSIYGYGIGQLLAYVAAEDKAYCRAHGIPWSKRVIPEYRAGPHPRSYRPDLPITRRTITLPGQLYIPMGD